LLLQVTPGAMTIGELVADLHAAGYAAVASGPDSIMLTLPIFELSQATGYFAWDFHDTDGTANATLHSVTPQAPP